MPLFDAPSLARFSVDAENAFAIEHKCLIERVALAIVSGTPNYLVSENILSIRRVTWKGQELWPAPQKIMKDTLQTRYFTTSSKPQYYIYNNVAQNAIRFFPTPNETVSAITTNLYGSEIPNRVIIEYWRLPDQMNMIPAYFRRRLLKTYVLSKCFQMEGKGQNFKGYGYFNKKYNDLTMLYSNLLTEISVKPRRLVLSNLQNFQNFPASPVLRWDLQGIGVDPGE